MNMQLWYFGWNSLNTIYVVYYVHVHVGVAMTLDKHTILYVRCLTIAYILIPSTPHPPTQLVLLIPSSFSLVTVLHWWKAGWGALGMGLAMQLTLTFSDLPLAMTVIRNLRKELVAMVMVSHAHTLVYWHCCLLQVIIISFCNLTPSDSSNIDCGLQWIWQL